jgi:DNA end-binding protein Ku
MGEPSDQEESDTPKPFWSGVVTFGLVSLPVSLFPATRSTTLRLRMVDAQGSLLRRRYFSGEDGTPLEPDDLVRGYEIEKGQLIVIEDDELEALDPEKSREINLGQFVSLRELDPVHFKRAYFLVPDGGTTKAYRLLARTMEDEHLAGIATFVMRGTEHLCAIVSERGILRAETLRFSDEVRSPEMIGLPDKRRPDARDVARFSQAIKALKTKKLDESQLEDRGSARIVRHAERKLKSGKDVVASPVDEEEAQESATNVIDLMQVLRQRLQGKEQAPPPAAGRSGGARTRPARSAPAADELESRTKAELYEMAQRMELPNRSAMTKAELIKAIRARPD